MCGIAGYIHKGDCNALCSTTEAQVHKLQACRGPDSQDTYTFTKKGITFHLYHQRLRIQDLSSSADQPMESSLSPGNFIVFNGEIYNEKEIKGLFVPNLSKRTNSDTEVLLESLVKTSLPEVLSSARGMFAFGFLDSNRGKLSLARDRFGEKPLHYWFNESQLFFSSQFDTTVCFLKSNRQTIRLNQNSILYYLMLGYFPYEHSMVENVNKLAPGSFIEFEFFGSRFNRTNEKRWFPRWKVMESQPRKFEVFHLLMQSVVEEQLVGDVPVGVFLSGGVDSTLISALAQSKNSQPIHSFSVGFERFDFDESKFALQAANELRTNHHALLMTEKDALDILPSVLKAYAEPLGDPSVFPTTFVSREARKHVTVALTGDGADEFFYGYGRYKRFLELERLVGVFQGGALKRTLSESLSWIPKELRMEKLQRIIFALSVNSPAMTYLSLIGLGHQLDMSSISNKDKQNLEIANFLWRKGFAKNPVNRLREIDIDSYLCDDILVKVDRASMAFGLETRAPFLDHRVQELASTAEFSWLNSTESKAVVKHTLEKYVSSSVFRRPKMGFGAPLGDWFAGSLREWAYSITSDVDWPSLGIESTYVIGLLGEVLKGKHDKSAHLWSLLSLGYAASSLKS